MKASLLGEYPERNLDEVRKLAIWKWRKEAQEARRSSGGTKHSLTDEKQGACLLKQKEQRKRVVSSSGRGALTALQNV